MELISYTSDNKDTFWINIGYHICKLNVDFQKIFVNIGQYNFYKTDHFMKLVFYYIHPNNIISQLGSRIYHIMSVGDYRNGHYIKFGEINLTIFDTCFDILKIISPDYTFTEITNNKRKLKSITQEDLDFINLTFNNYETLLYFILNDYKFSIKLNKDDDDWSIKKINQEVQKQLRTINRLKKYIQEISIR
jgi:hypothetical protein